ncbi:PilN domain-containing protein [Demequina subtropica]|uniref:PilN domain-containing protein n=1 Tax=Demequina subtropica TaxID=1638989 RepID=UPI0007835D35|nr:PilN domain-containing protein [Demequina subtropica]
MNPVPESVKAPQAPQVNLLPPEIEARRTQGRAKGLLAFALLALAVVLGAAWFWFHSERVAAEDALAAEEARTPELQAELASYDYINGVAADYKNALLARAWAGATDVEWAAQVDALMEVFPKGVALTSMQVTPATPYGAVADDGTVFAQSDMGAITFAGSSSEPVDVADLIEQIDGLPGFTGTWIDTETIASVEGQNDPYYEYSGSVRVTYNVLSNRLETEQTKADPDVLAAISGEDN